jgi:hypothetical protein
LSCICLRLDIFWHGGSYRHGDSPELDHVE